MAPEVLFLVQIVVLLACARLFGELLQRLGQPAVMGQLIAGVLLGRSVFGALWPAAQHALFPDSAVQNAMLGAVAQLGILMLLLLTGMETDLTLFRRSPQTALSVSLGGIVVPFLCGVGLGELIPAALLPDPNRRLITALFLGTALSISSVKIVATIVRELGFLRRTVGQVILAAAVIDDAVGWIIVSVIFGIAAHGALDLGAAAQSLFGVAAFLVLSFTLGRGLVFRIIRWANDRFVSEFPVITAILVVTGMMALATEGIGVHTVLGAFVAGILVGQSPILTRHIEEQLRGLIVALFMPVFFALAGLGTDVSLLAGAGMLSLTSALIVIASFGKLSGALLGGRLAGMSWAESLALGCGMNSRGSTEVILGTIGLSMGVLSQNLFTAIIAMALATTMSMPPLLRWALRRLPMSPEEAARLEREELEARGFIANVERLLVAVDASPSGQLASRLVGLLAGARRIPTTVLHFDHREPGLRRRTASRAERTRAVVEESAEAGNEAGPSQPGEASVDITTRVESPRGEAIAEEARKGYGLLFIGREPASAGAAFHRQIASSARSFEGPFVVAIARGIDRREVIGTRLEILVPVSGTGASRHGAELAVALARATQGSVTALHVAACYRRPRSWIGAAIAPRGSADAIIREVVRLGDSYGVEVRGTVRNAGPPAGAIARQLEQGGHNLLLMGVAPRPGEQLFFGETAAELLDRAQCSIVFVASEPLAPAPEQRRPGAGSRQPASASRR